MSIRMRHTLIIATILTLGFLSLTTVTRIATATPIGGEIRRISVSTEGVEANGFSSVTSISADGRYVTFYSLATNLDPHDTTTDTDSYLVDTTTGVTELVSDIVGITSGKPDVSNSSISSNGRYIVFASNAADLVPSDTNDFADVFVHDLTSGANSRVSVTSEGAEANGSSWGAAISADGRYIAFLSTATNFTPSDTNSFADVFVHDILKGTTQRASQATDGTQGNGESGFVNISANGRYVGFNSNSTTLVPSSAFSGTAVFLHNIETQETEIVSVASDGTHSNEMSNIGTISTDGRYVLFDSFASNLVDSDTNTSSDVFVRDRVTGETRRVSLTAAGGQANNHSNGGSISADNRYVVYSSLASNIVAGDGNTMGNLFLRDMETNAVTRLSLAFDGSEANGHSGVGLISGDGQRVVFDSVANNIVKNDTNNQTDVFLKEMNDRNYLLFLPYIKQENN